MRENRFKIGDRVRMRDDLEDGKIYGGLHYLSPFMDRFQGRIMKIVEVFSGDHYYLDGCLMCGEYYFISADMLEKAKPAEFDPAWDFDRKGAL